ncbi:hypothetical protein FIV42_15465 [Persicimonas caeni]|uniref:Uncharacterized protein n=1 Tax=Persicimonas caeni TaxID=2292766 RepID=A0A4Y6PV17_PERCE|nr:hypothetical protein [Persicimonas caeni]QDG52090.1 hypothetical protein FIV42_15465 [Persicimonas caeni]QED33311.1 hypothetical protein FRD00_15460 [Persicimonas caeni]
MPAGQIQIVEFRGHVAGTKQGEVTTYLLAIDGDYRTKYLKPSFEYLPKSWRDKYQVESYDVGRAGTWQEFYEKCNARLEQEDPFATAKSGSAQVNTDDDKTDELEVPNVPESGGGLEEASSAMDSSVRGVFESFLEDPPERRLSLQFEVNGYMSLLQEEEQRLGTVDLPLARAIANSALKLLDHVASDSFESDDYSMVQAAIRYFTVAEDASSDFEEGGFDDDAEVLNLVARKLGREDLVVPLSERTTTV